MHDEMRFIAFFSVMGVDWGWILGWIRMVIGVDQRVETRHALSLPAGFFIRN